jgi:uncharacterized protein YcbX
VPINRFRPNFVVRGAAPFAEDTWGHFRIGESYFYGVKPCARCVMTTIDQETRRRAASRSRRWLRTAPPTTKSTSARTSLYANQGTRVAVGDPWKCCAR